MCFCKTRKLNKELYEWMSSELLIEFINDIKQSQQLDDNLFTYFNLDGEDLQINVYKDYEVQSILKENKVVSEKPTGSTTSITQPVDARGFIKPIKGTIKGLKKSTQKNIF